MDIGSLIGIGVVAALIVGVVWFKESSLNDPNNHTMIHADQMGGNHMLRTGPVSAALFRQSGNLHRDLGDFASADEALAEILKAFKRAKIDSLVVVVNTSERYEVHRLHHNHRGRAEGKRVGGAVIAVL
ncbi:MAG: hypothetical protein ACU0A4_09350 [Paracoccaceae bacterium]